MKATFAFILPAVATANDGQWDAWKMAHGRNYATSQEEQYRHSVFITNMRQAAEQQSNILDGAEYGPNEFSDWTPTEFRERLLGFVSEQTSIPAAPRVNISSPLPSSKDWTGTATTPIKNQGHCGSCWAFSATEQLESDFILQQGGKFVLGPQELVDCNADRSERDGCQGGEPTSAYKVIEALGGMEAESDYPYVGRNDQCSFSKSKVKITVTGYQSVGRGDEDEMKKYVGTTGPLSVCGDAASWQSYRGGVKRSCSSGGGHCFQVVGYGVDNGVEYWKVRNSWGSSWGENGFIRLEYGKNLCGIAGMPTKVTAEAVSPLPSIVV